MAPEAGTTTEGGWITLFDGSNLDGWTQLGDANWRIVDGAVEADSGSGFLVTDQSFEDFQLLLEFWVNPEANSGIFIRCENPAEVRDTSCYEVNIYDQRPDPTYRTGGIVDLEPPLVQIDAGNQWNTYDITADGSHIVVRLNDQLTVDMMNDAHPSGPFALQYGEGIVRFRNVRIRPLDAAAAPTE